MRIINALLSTSVFLIFLFPQALGAPPGGPLTIEEVVVIIGDPDTTLEINGFDFGGSPQVTLAGALATVSTATNTMIIATVDTGSFPAGEYLLTVSAGNGQNQNDEYDLTIGAVGPPAFFRATLGGQLTLTSLNTFFPYAATEVEDEGNLFDAGNGRFVAPTDGVYHFDVSVAVVCPTALEAHVRVILQKNVDTASFMYDVFQSVPVGPQLHSLSGSVTTRLSANDTVTVVMEQTTGNDSCVAGSVPLPSLGRFSGYMVH